MALTLLGSGNARIEHGDVSELAGATAMAVAFTIKIAGTLTGNRFCGQWGATATEESFLVAINDTDEIGFVVNAGGGALFGRKTTGLNIATSTLFRCCLIWWATGNMELWVNGSLETDTSWFAGTVSTLQDATTTVFVGHEATSTIDGVDGDYSEFALWAGLAADRMPSDIAKAISNGWSPQIWPHDAVIHDRLQSTARHFDRLDNYTSTLTGGANADSPGLIKPAAPQIFLPIAAPPVGGFFSRTYYDQHLGGGSN